MTIELILKFSASLIGVVLVLTIAFLTYQKTFFPQLNSKRGFFCFDETIRYPYKEKDTITATELFAICISVPLIMILIIEVLNEIYAKYSQLGEKFSPTILFGKEIPLWIWNIVIVIGVFLLGFGFTFYITNVGKLTLGQLRPYFISVCQPNINLNMCDRRYITDYVCLNTNTDLIKEARQSFPSKYASLTFYSVFFLVIYIQIRLIWDIGLLKPTIQALLILFFFYIGLTRLPDFKNHWSDVLAGFSLGSFIALIIWWLLILSLPESNQQKIFSVENRIENVND